MPMTARQNQQEEKKKDIWIYPCGTLGDVLMLSGVLKQCIDRNPQQKYNLIRRALYADLLNGHPAFALAGHPPKDATVVTSDYRLMETPGPGSKRPYQILARKFGLRTPVQEILYLPGLQDEDTLLHDFISSDNRKIAVIAPSSANPRKMTGPAIWLNIVEELKRKGVMVIQVGEKEDMYVKGSYSLLGLTTPRQLISLLAICDCVIGVDNFVMHAAHLIGKPAVILWGPTRSKVYGYSGHIAIQCPVRHCKLRNHCPEPASSTGKFSPCPLKDRHCMNLISPDTVLKKAIDICFPADY
jgi:ADP-heptose:LPS heptosyltransferase